MVDLGWNEERTNLLKSLTGRGSNAWIAREINAATGSTFSRNAIIGKRLRLGLMDQVQKKEDRRGKGSKRILRADFKRGPSLGPDFELLNEIEKTVAPPEFLGLTLFQLNATTCHYPRGTELPFLYCGQPVKDDSSYCPYCHSQCHEKPKRLNPETIEQRAARTRKVMRPDVWNRANWELHFGDVA